MGAYNRVNGEACCASPTLLQKILRDAWGFDGFVVSDCGAVDDIYSNHKIVKTSAEAAALAVINGCDLECGCTYGIPCDYWELSEAVEQGLLTEADLDRSVKRLFMARFRLGMLIDESSLCPAHAVVVRLHRGWRWKWRANRWCCKNQDHGTADTALKSIAVIGPNAAETVVLLGNYMGTPAEPVSVLDGIRALVSPKTQVNYARGCELSGDNQDSFAEAIQAAQQSDIAVVVLGLSQLLEGEQAAGEGLPPGVQPGDGKRRTPNIQEQLLIRPRARPSSWCSSMAARWPSIGPTSMCRRFWRRGIPARRAARPSPKRSSG
jgi:beta-glucosidase